MKKLLFALAAFTTLVSCMQEKVETPSLFREVKIMASAAETKTTLDGNSVVWENGDAIALNFTNNDGDYVTSFSTAGSGTSAQFTGTLPGAVSTLNGYAAEGYAVYPASAMDNEGNVSFTVPFNVTADEDGSFSNGENLTSAVVSLADLDADGTTSAKFKNALSIIRFTLDSGVKELVLSTGTGKLAGEANMSFVTSGDSKGRLALSSTPSAGEMTIHPEGSGFTSGKTYNVLVYPGQYKDITATLTDQDGCTFTKTVEGTYDFAAANFYTFSFVTKFVKALTFTSQNMTFTAGTDKIQAVFGDLYNETLTAEAGNKFTVNLPHEVIEQNIKGYVVYPSTAYSAGKVYYTLDPDLDYQTGTKIWTATITPESESVSFLNLNTNLAKIKFILPEGVKSLDITSDKGLFGKAEVMVLDNGTPSALEGDQKTLALQVSGLEEKTIYSYVVSGANLNIKLTDASEVTATRTASLNLSAGSEFTIDLSSVSFEKNGSFENEDFVDSNTEIEFK